MRRGRNPCAGSGLHRDFNRGFSDVAPESPEPHGGTATGRASVNAHYRTLVKGRRQALIGDPTPTTGTPGAPRLRDSRPRAPAIQS